MNNISDLEAIYGQIGPYDGTVWDRMAQIEEENRQLREQIEAGGGRQEQPAADIGSIVSNRKSKTAKFSLNGREVKEQKTSRPKVLTFPLPKVGRQNSSARMPKRGQKKQ